MDKLKYFLKRKEVREQLNKSPSELLSMDFNRDPFRAIYYDKNVMLSPADGFVLYAKEVDPAQDIINVKGGDYCVNTLLREEIKERCLVIGIFMTAIDPHVNRVPTNGFVSFEKLPCLKVTNLSMRPIEKAILDELKIDYDNMKYAFYNEAYKNKILVPHLDQSYWLIQIADFEVDVIAHFGKQMDFFTQGERFSVIKFGSQVDLILPLYPGKCKFKSLVPDDGIYHVQAGVDPIVRIARGKDNL
jgi:phosphatidylserine decarboxylase